MDYKYAWIRVTADEILQEVPEGFPDREIAFNEMTKQPVIAAWIRYFRRVEKQADGSYVCLTGHYPNGVSRLTDVTEEECQRFLNHFGEDRICDKPGKEELN